MQEIAVQYYSARTIFTKLQSILTVSEFFQSTQFLAPRCLREDSIADSIHHTADGAVQILAAAAAVSHLPDTCFSSVAR